MCNTGLVSFTLVKDELIDTKNHLKVGAGWPVALQTNVAGISLSTTTLCGCGCRVMLGLL